MDETRLGSDLTLDAQALMLLDHPDGKFRRQQVELFSSPESFVARSFSNRPQIEEKKSTVGRSLCVAARLASDRYEERAKESALYQALKTLQERNRSFSGKIIRAK